jgi:uncharacterized protein YqeY
VNSERTPAGVRVRLRAALPAAMKARDAAAVAALRSALAAIDNAEAADVGEAPAPVINSADVAGSVVGVGAAEAPRRVLTEAEAAAIVRAEVADRLAAAHDYEQVGRLDRAERLRAEAAALGAYVGPAAAGDAGIAAG